MNSVVGTPGQESIRVLKVNEASAVVRMSRSKLYADMDAGLLAYIKIGRSRRIPEWALMEYLQRGLVPARCT